MTDAAAGGPTDDHRAGFVVSEVPGDSSWFFVSNGGLRLNGLLSEESKVELRRFAEDDEPVRLRGEK